MIVATNKHLKIVWVRKMSDNNVIGAETSLDE